MDLAHACWAKAAWQLSDWDIADRLLKAALSVAKINPIANKLLAEYLTDKLRQTNNAHFLRLLSHAPKLSILSIQIST